MARPVHRGGLAGRDGGVARYRLSLEPALALLHLRRDRYIFQDKTVQDIVTELLSDYPQLRFEFDIGQTSPPAPSPTFTMNIVKFLILAFIFSSASLSFACTGNDCILTSQANDQNCVIDGTSLWRCGQMGVFLEIDKRLNKQYSELMRSTKKEHRALLKKAQRSWIIWRDERCTLAEEESGCNNGICSGYNHDSCIVNLTRQRADELSDFTVDLSYGVGEKYAYKKEYVPSVLLHDTRTRKPIN